MKCIYMAILRVCYEMHLVHYIFIGYANIMGTLKVSLINCFTL